MNINIKNKRCSAALMIILLSISIVYLYMCISAKSQIEINESSAMAIMRIICIAEEQYSGDRMTRRFHHAKGLKCESLDGKERRYLQLEGLKYGTLEEIEKSGRCINEMRFISDFKKSKKYLFETKIKEGVYRGENIPCLEINARPVIPGVTGRRYFYLNSCQGETSKGPYIRWRYDFPATSLDSNIE